MKFLHFFLSVFFITSCSPIGINQKEDKTQSPRVVAVYPSSDSLPENLLRFYVQFSHSMKAINNLENIKLLNEKGEEVEGAIFNNVYELWDSEQKQLTLILDPARVKTGLVAHEALGRALELGKHFKLMIERAEDIYGNQLDEVFVKNFYVTKADVDMPDVNHWAIVAPKPRDKKAFQISFPQSLDRMSLLDRIGLFDSKGEMVKGRIEIVNQEKIWRFTPFEKWHKGIYTLRVNSRIEDPSGNNLNGLFEHEIGSLKNRQEGKILELEVEVK